MIFLVPGIAALVIEPVMFLLADRYPRRWFIAGGTAVMAVGAAGAAIAPDAITLSLAISLWAIATGVSGALAQATLVDRNPEQRARSLARWTLVSLGGDLVAPLLLAALAAANLSWRFAFGIVAVALAIQAVALAVAMRPQADVADSHDEHATASPERSGPSSDELVPAPSNSDPAEQPPDESASEPLLRSLATALRDHVLLGWLFATALCDLLDEILVVFASLQARENGVGPTGQAALLGAFMVGGACGLALLDRLLVRHPERRLMIVNGLACAALYAGWLAASISSAFWISILLMFGVGATSATLYPLCAAQSYARCPDRSGVVLAAGHLFTPLGLALPWLLGLVADHAGLPVALALLVVEPLGVAALSAALASRSRAGN